MIHHHLVRERYLSALSRLIMGPVAAIVGVITYIHLSEFESPFLPGWMVILCVAIAPLMVAVALASIKPFLYFKRLKKAAEDELNSLGRSPLTFRMFYNEHGETYSVILCFCLVTAGFLIESPWGMGLKLAGLIGMLHTGFRLVFPSKDQS